VCERQRRDEGGRGGREEQRFVCELLARIARGRTVNIEGVVVKRRRKLFGVVSFFFFFFFPLKIMADARYFGVAVDYSPSSKYAFKWAVDNVFRAGDVVILLFVNKDSRDGDAADLWGAGGSRKNNNNTAHLLSVFFLSPPGCEFCFFLVISSLEEAPLRGTDSSFTVV
jgi:hypothetical protein